MNELLTPLESDPRLALLERRERLVAAAKALPPQTGLSRLLGEVDAALARIEEGSYGLCETCHDPIEDDRLASNPLTRFCIDHLSPEEQRALEEDMETAAHLQRAMLPSGGTALPGWDVAFAFQPASLVSGDFCAVFDMADGTDSLFVLGDVSGKGIPAALLASSLQATIRSLATSDRSIASIVGQANRIFRSAALARRFATLVCGRLRGDGSVDVCNAGHCPPLLVREDRTEEIGPTGLPVGTFYSSGYSSLVVNLEPGDTLLLYSDGLTEALDAGDAAYGPERLGRVVSEMRDRSARALVAACLEDLDLHAAGRRSDDVTLLAIRRAGPAAS